MFLRLLRDAGLPEPRTNKRKGSYFVDCRWPEHKLTVELDSYRYQHTRHAWEQDHRREWEARAGGDEFRRFTWGQLTEHRDAVKSQVAALLAR
jgi:very-short-patch-repair endonuclease